MLELDRDYALSMKEEVNVMNALSHNIGSKCLWQYLLEHFEGRQNSEFSCNKCSICQPDGDIAPSSQVVSDFIKLRGPQTGITIIACNRIGDQLQIDEDRIKDLFSQCYPSMINEPVGKWTICPIPDSEGKNIREAEELAEWLNGMSVCSFIQKNPEETRKVTDAKSAVERADILTKKFIFDKAQMPRIGNVLIFDNYVSSGATIDYVVQWMKDELHGAPVDFVALTLFAYPVLPRIVDTLNQVDTL